MKDELITQPTAQLARQAGYNIPSSNVFIQNSKGVLRESDLVLPLSHGDIKSLTGNENVWLRPTQSLLQRWLREKHDVEINILDSVKDFGADKVYIPDVRRNKSRMHGGHYATYELALEEALINALGVILKEIL